MVSIPGLSQDIEVPDGADVYISTDGGLVTTGTLGAFSIVDIALLIDAQPPSASLIRRIVANNAAQIGPIPAYWSVSTSTRLPAGRHTITVTARYMSGAAAFVSGDSTSTVRGQLTTVLVKR